MLTSLEWSFAIAGRPNSIWQTDERRSRDRPGKQFMGSEFRVFRRLEGLGLGFTAYEVRVLASRFTGFSLSNDSPTYMLCQGPSRTRRQHGMCRQFDARRRGHAESFRAVGSVTFRE